MNRFRVAVGILMGLRRHDFRAARNWINTMYSGRSLPRRLLLFFAWAVRMLWVAIPETRRWACFATPISKTPIWLAGDDPFENYPFKNDPNAQLPREAEVVVIGCGFIGSAVAYHWSKFARSRLLVLEANGVASGSAGRNEGLVVMGRHYYQVHSTVLRHLNRERLDLIEGQRNDLAHEFAAAYVRAAHANARMIAETICNEGIECEYVQKGWVQVPNREGLRALDASTEMARERGFPDWTKISSEEAGQHCGIRTNLPAAFSVGAATWHPAKWVRGLVRISLASDRVDLFTRTRVLKVEASGAGYSVRTQRGVVQAHYVVNATESHSPQLFPEFHDIVLPMQTQAAFGESECGTMKSGVGISSDRAFYGRHANGVLFGSDSTRVPDREAGRNQPLRFVTNFVLTEMKPLFQIHRLRVTNEWSGTVSYTPDEYPLVGKTDGKGLYIIAGLAGSGSGHSFNAGRHVVSEILGIDGPNYYPEKYFSPLRFSPVRRAS
jgi:glycine/D-amino acid oxidase-like deaminating enzyme